MNTIQDIPRSQTEKVYGVIRIGNGAKLHPGVQYADGHWFFQCSCPGTQSGWSKHKSKFYSSVQHPNLIPTCKN
jgi:hypothetical protein